VSVHPETSMNTFTRTLRPLLAAALAFACAIASADEAAIRKTWNQQHPNGFDPDTKYEPAGTQTLIDTDEVVQPGNLFVMGDNRTPGGSYDSREWGELPSSYIIGNAVLRLLPLDQVRIL